MSDLSLIFHVLLPPLLLSLNYVWVDRILTHILIYHDNNLHIREKLFACTRDVTVRMIESHSMQLITDGIMMMDTHLVLVPVVGTEWWTYWHLCPICVQIWYTIGLRKELAYEIVFESSLVSEIAVGPTTVQTSKNTYQLEKKWNSWRGSF